MSKYPNRPLGEVITLDLDQVQVKKDDSYEISGVYSFGRGLFGRDPIKGSDTSYKKLNRLHVDHLVMSRLKAFEGAISVIPNDFEGWFLSNEFPTFRIDKTRADVAYIRHICTWPDFWRLLSSESKGLGSRRERVDTHRLLSIEVPIPNLGEQQRVAARLDSAFAGFRAIVERRKRNRSRMIALVDQIFGQIEHRRPLGLFIEQVSDMVKIDTEALLRIAGIYSFGRGLIDRGEIFGSETSYQQLAKVRAGQLVMSKLNAWEGALAVVPEKFDGYYVSPEYPVFDIDTTHADVQYVDYLVRWSGTWQRLAPRGSMVRRKRINPSALLGLEVPFPEYSQQCRVVEKLACIEEIRHRSSAQEARLEEFRESLLNAAFNGDL